MEKLPENDNIQCSEGLVGFDFNFQRGTERVTTGIHMSNEIFKHDYEDGRKVAIILLDTQGIYDPESNPTDNAKIFALSTLLSSVQIFNVFNQIEEIDLEQLQLFAGFAELTAKDKVSKLFQRLLFLVRDWTQSDDFGFDGGQNYIAGKMEVKPSQKLEQQSLRRHLKSSFEVVDCFLMPEPGKKVKTSNDCNVKLSDIDQDFLDNVGMFLPELLDSKKLKVKEINGQPVNAQEFVELFETYFTALNSDVMPEIKAIYDITSEVHNQIIFRKCQQFYAYQMTQTDRALFLIYPDNSDLRAKHVATKNETLEQFDREAMLHSTSADNLKDLLDKFLEFSLKGFLAFNNSINVIKNASTTIEAGAAVGLAVASVNGIVAEAIGLPSTSVTGAITKFIAYVSLHVLSYMIAQFMSWYEIQYSPPSLSNKKDLTDSFWQKHFDRSEKPQIQELD